MSTNFVEASMCQQIRQMLMLQKEMHSKFYDIVHLYHSHQKRIFVGKYPVEEESAGVTRFIITQYSKWDYK